MQSVAYLIFIPQSGVSDTLTITAAMFKTILFPFVNQPVFARSWGWLSPFHRFGAGQAMTGLFGPVGIEFGTGCRAVAQEPPAWLNMWKKYFGKMRFRAKAPGRKKFLCVLAPLREYSSLVIFFVYLHSSLKTIDKYVNGTNHALVRTE
jgi:hypothetical protein